MTINSEFCCEACKGRVPGETVQIPDFEYALPFRAVYVACAACGSYTQTPMPDGMQLSSFYPSDYHSMLPASAISRFRQRMRIAQLRRSVGTETFNKTILDFGCGQGLFLNAAAESFPRGRFLGYEIADKNTVEQRYDGRVTIFRGDTEFFWNEVPKVDLVTMNHVIEHLPHPLGTLENIRAILAPEGRFEGQTPNADCYERRIFGVKWSGYHAPRHTVVFSTRGLEALLTDAGFTDVQVKPGFNPASWAISLGSALQDTKSPVGIPRTGLKWLGLVIAAIGPSWIESRTEKSGIVDFSATKTA